MEIVNHIEIKDGHAVIRGHGHLKAKMVARKHVWEGLNIDEVMEHYGLSASEVHAALAYYYDNEEAFDAEYERLTSEVQGTSLDDLKAKIKARQQKK